MDLNFPSYISSLRSYEPGPAIHELQKQFGFQRAALLWNNENLRGPSEKVRLVLNEITELNLYPDATCQNLKDAISRMAHVPANHVVPGNGSEGVLNYCLKGLMGPGENLVTSEGTFAPVYIWCQSHNIPVTKVPLDNGYRFNPEALVDAVTPETRMIYISNPNNPTGTWLGREELTWILERMPKNVFLLLDEAYWEYARMLVPDFPDGTSFHDPRVIVLRTFSKAFGLAGARIGYGLCEPIVATQLNKMRLTFEPSLPAQLLGIAAAGDLDYAEESSGINKEQLQKMSALFSRSGYKVIPTAGNFLMIDTGSSTRCEKLTKHFFRNGILVRKLSGFGLPQCIRMNSGLEEDFSQIEKIIEMHTTATS